MSESITIAQYAVQGGVRLGGTQTTYSADSLFSISSLVTNAGDQLYAAALDVSQIVAVFIVAAADMTLEWNTNAGIQGSIALKANIPISWNSTDTDDVHPNPLLGDATDIIAFYITNASGDAAQFDLRVVIDPTV